jgi:hypothetical protein
MTGPAATASLANRVEAALAKPPLNEISAAARAELLDSVAAAADLADLPGKWQAAILNAEGAQQGAGGGCHSS